MTALELEAVIRIVCHVDGGCESCGMPILKKLQSQFIGTLRPKEIVDILISEDIYWVADPEDAAYVIHELSNVPTKHVP